MTGTNIVLPSIYRARYSTPRTMTLWGRDYRRTPEVIHERLGDGLQVIGLEPIMTRPNYYVLFVDSSWDMDNDDWYDHLDDEIYNAIEDQCGRSWEEYEDSRGRMRTVCRGFPGFSDDGCSWWQIKMLSRF